MIYDQLRRPLRSLRLSVTDRCNFRCGYCMPREKSYHFLPPEEILSFEEIDRVLSVLTELGVSKVKLTGGEPLLRPWLPALIEKIARKKGIEDLALITNGHFLKKSAPRLKAAGLHRLTVSLDSLSPERNFRITGGRGSVKIVLEGIEAALKAGFSPLKINMMVKEGMNDEDILPMAEYFRSSDYILRFIEYMDVGTLNSWKSAEVRPSEKILRKLEEKFVLEPSEMSEYGRVGRRYLYKDGSGSAVEFVSSVSRPFCRECSRLRLSASGNLYTCLFSRRGHDLKSLMRSGASEEELRDFIVGLWSRRTDRYSEERREQRRSRPVFVPENPGVSEPEKVEMYRMGG